MARTFKESEKGSRVGNSYLLSSQRTGGPSVEGLGDPLGIVTGIPSGLVPDSVSDRFDSRQERRSDRVQSITERIGIVLEDDLGIEDLGGTISTLNDIDLNSIEDQPELLRFIGETQRINASINAARLQNDITVVSLLNEVLGAVEPAFGISVNGISAIEDEGVAQPVVDRSDDIDIPTKKFVMRASPRNDEAIYVGDDKVEPEDGFVLRPGESKETRIDFRDQELYMASGSSGDEVSFIGVV